MASSTNSNGLKSIEDKFLDTGDLFGLKFAGGFLFFEVTGWEQLRYAPYSGVGEVEAESNSGFSRLEEGGDDILYLERSEELILHAGIGHSPASVRRFTNYPEGQNRLRTIPNLTVPRPGRGPSYGYVDGNDTPYDQPTDAEELFIPPGVHLDFDFYNPNQNKSVTPILNIKARKYSVRILDPTNRGDVNAIRRIVSPGSPIPVANVGSMDTQYDAPNNNDWDVQPISNSELEDIRSTQ